MSAIEKLAAAREKANIKMAEEDLVNEVVGNVAIQSMDRALETGSTKHAAEALESYSNMISIKIAKDGEWINTTHGGEGYKFHNVPAAMEIMKNKGLSSDEKHKQLLTAKLMKKV